MFKLKDIKANKGITLNKDGYPMQFNKGYQVSQKDLEIIPAYRLTKKHLIEILNKLPKGVCLGVWIDDGKAYIDQSVRYMHKTTALKLGKAFNQISIWDWQNSKAIPC